MTGEHVDVLIVGAGISGIGAAYHLQKCCPDKSFAILEGREAVGGTWDLFRYPGIRSDSDMHTFGYAFRAWTDREAIASAPAILRYLNETATEHGFFHKIRFNHRVISACWSSEDARWTVSVSQTATGETVEMTCCFLYMCTGYFNYEQGYLPEFPGRERFRGRIVHPQKWTGDIDYAGKKVVVIGSGATAITMVPVMAETASHVTMLQRSPTYVVARPTEDRLDRVIRNILPRRMVYTIVRWKNVVTSSYFFNFSRRQPAKARKRIMDQVRKALGADYDVDTHFNPRYNVWDQRVCLVPDGDLFKAIRGGKASVVTDHIETFTEGGVRLKSGKELDADLIVTATGLDVQLLSNIPLSMDGVRINPSKSFQYKGVMFSDIPNLAWTIGYANAAWTLKVDLTSEYVAKLLRFMDRHGYRSCTPKVDDPNMPAHSYFDYTSGYVQRARDILPKQGDRYPWRLRQNYFFDIFTLRFSRIKDGVMVFR